MVNPMSHDSEKRQQPLTKAVKFVLLGTLVLSTAMLGAQTNPSPPASADTTTLSARSNLVLVPALVTIKSGEVVFALTANDFVLTDNGVPQLLRMEEDNDAQPIAIVVVMQTGGQGAAHLNDYAGLASVLDAVIGNVPYRIAAVGFDSQPHLDLDFTADKVAAADAVSKLSAGDGGAAILDSLSFGIGLLRKQPPAYRRVVLLFSETIDNGSQSTFQQALRAVDDTNTSIYSFGFSSEKIALKHEASKAPRPGGSEYSSTPYGAGGCMAKGSDPDANGNRAVQALDCASDLLPPLRLPRLAYIAASEGFKRNIPEAVAQLTGGEYFSLKNSKLLSRDLVKIANDLPNHYVLSFSPKSPDPGFHVVELKLKDRPDLEVRARNAYWIDAEAIPAQK
jgi:VWFA-related protein